MQPVKSHLLNIGNCSDYTGEFLKNAQQNLYSVILAGVGGEGGVGRNVA